MPEPVIIGNATLLLGDAPALMRAMPVGSVDLVFGSPLSNGKCYRIAPVGGCDAPRWPVERPNLGHKPLSKFEVFGRKGLLALDNLVGIPKPPCHEEGPSASNTWNRPVANGLINTLSINVLRGCRLCRSIDGLSGQRFEPCNLTPQAMVAHVFAKVQKYACLSMFNTEKGKESLCGVKGLVVGDFPMVQVVPARNRWTVNANPTAKQPREKFHGPSFDLADKDHWRIGPTRWRATALDGNATIRINDASSISDFCRFHSQCSSQLGITKYKEKPWRSQLYYSTDVPRLSVAIVWRKCGGCPKTALTLFSGRRRTDEDARLYDMNFRLRGQAWVDWMVEVVRASLHVSRGLVAFVVEGRTRKFRWSGTPMLLGADLIRAGVCLRKPPAYKRSGIPGSGGPDWLRNDYEFIVCATNGGKLPWSDNTAMGKPTKYDEGGASSNRRPDGSRVGYAPRATRAAVGTHRAERQAGRKYARPASGIANPGNIIDCGATGGGNMGDKLCHENEAPFSEALAEHFVRSFCPLGGTVLDPFSGSGTTAAVALRWGRKAIAIDIRESQIELTRRRIAKVDLPLLAGGQEGGVK